jgi:hypothetical protein
MEDRDLKILVVRYREQMRQDELYAAVTPKRRESLYSFLESEVSHLTEKLGTPEAIKCVRISAIEFRVECATKQTFIARRDDLQRIATFVFERPPYQGGNTTESVRLELINNNVQFCDKDGKELDGERIALKILKH